MSNLKRNGRILALLVIMGILFGTQGMTALAGTMGVGAAAGPAGGPGMEAAGPSDQNDEQEKPSETDGVQSAEGQPAGGSEAQGESGQSAAGSEIQDTADHSTASSDLPLQVNYSIYSPVQGWSGTAADNQALQAPYGSWVAAMRANLINIPADAQVGIRYQVNLSGTGWLDPAEDGAEAGNASAEAPLEAICMELYGASAASYDLYYKVYQNGTWTDWALNGAVAGTEGAGLRIDGIRAAITAKDAGAPQAAMNAVDPSRPMIALTFDDGPRTSVTSRILDSQAAMNAVDPSRPMIALTFDDGPRTSVTSRILDSLQQNGGRATFFMVGTNVDSNAAVIRRMAEQGCEVANHTNDHKYLTKIGAEGIRSQVGSANQKIASACGVSPVLMRPPGGYVDSASLSVLGSMGMPAIMWSIDTRDWQHRNAQRTIDTVLDQVKDGDIILMHDIYEPTAQAAEVLIPELTARGYQLVTVSELASFRGGIQPGHKYSQFR